MKHGTTHFTSSIEVHQFKQIKKIYPDGLIQILLKPVRALHIISCLKGFQRWLTGESMTHTAALQTPWPKHLGILGGGIQEIELLLEKVSHSTEQ